MKFESHDSWTILSPIEQEIKKKIEAIGIPLKEWDISINYGIKTGLNDAFIISGEKRAELIAADPKSAEIIRPILRGRDIKRYGYEYADLWLIWVPWHFPLHLDTTITGCSMKAENAFMDQYPAVYSHLLCYKKQLEKRNKAETGIRYEWYALQRWGANYWDDFSKPKIIYPNMTKFLPFVYDESGFVTNQKCFIITGELMAYLTAFLNSSLFKYCFRDSFPELLGGTRELSKIFFDKIPVRKVDEKTNEFFLKKVKEIQNNYSEQLAIEIDNTIFDLYELSDEERRIIGYRVIQ